MLYYDRCLGVLLGVAAGDCLGSPVEFKTKAEIINLFGRLRDFQSYGNRVAGDYTDDTEMTLVLADSLIQYGKVDFEKVSSSYADTFIRSDKGYGPSVCYSLAFINSGGSPLVSGKLIHKEGSYANGGVMRIAPVGLVYRNASMLQLKQAVTDAIYCTHCNVEAIDTAVSQALAVSLLCNDSVDSKELINILILTAETVTLKCKLITVKEAVDNNWTEQITVANICSPNQFGETFQIKATEAFSCALWAMLTNWSNPEEAVITAVNIGGDTDTVGAITGALVGAKNGVTWIPDRWVNKIIDVERIKTTAKSLAEITYKSNINE